MGHQDCNVITGAGEVGIQQQAMSIIPNVLLNRFFEFCAGSDVASDRADIGLDYRKCGLH
jgi:hypothetical protein